MASRMTAGILILAIALSACTPAPGSQKLIDVSFTIFAYADTDGDGKHDAGEQPLSQVLVITDSNIHGALACYARRTDTNGEAPISGIYTHFFDVKVVPPCGYTPTTPNTFGARDLKRELPVGFLPATPQPGDAVVRFHVWDDANQNGVQEDDEEPVSAMVLSLDIPVPGELSNSFGVDIGEINTEMAVMLDNGQGQINLGNSCGTLRVLLPNTDQWQPVNISPEPEFEETAGGADTLALRFEVAPGETNIEIGVRADNE